MSPAPTITFRLADEDRALLAQLEEELACAKVGVIRAGLAALRADPGLRDQLRADRVARAFLARLQAQHGGHAILQIRNIADRTTPSAQAVWVMSQRPVDPRDVRIDLHHADGQVFVDLIDATTGVGIRNAYWTDYAPKDVVLPIAAVSFWPALTVADPQDRTLPDGRRATVVRQEDGTTATYVLDEDGTSPLLHEDSRAAWFDTTLTAR